MSADHIPPGSPANGSPAADQPVKSPVTATPVASGAQTRNVTPPSKGTAPMPGRADAACRPSITSRLPILGDRVACRLREDPDENAGAHAGWRIKVELEALRYVEAVQQYLDTSHRREAF